MTTKVGDIVQIKLGRVVFDIKPGDDISRDICFVCGKPATAWPIPEGSMAHGFVSINGEKPVLLCVQCFTTEEKTGDTIIKKFWNAPDLKISKGGIYENIDEIREIADAIKARGDKSTN
jgi:hypothetical protein